MSDIRCAEQDEIGISTKLVEFTRGLQAHKDTFRSRHIEQWPVNVLVLYLTGRHGICRFKTTGRPIT